MEAQIAYQKTEDQQQAEALDATYDPVLLKRYSQVKETFISGTIFCLTSAEVRNARRPLSIIFPWACEHGVPSAFAAPRMAALLDSAGMRPLQPNTR